MNCWLIIFISIYIQSIYCNPTEITTVKYELNTLSNTTQNTAHFQNDTAVKVSTIHTKKSLTQDISTKIILATNVSTTTTQSTKLVLTSLPSSPSSSSSSTLITTTTTTAPQTKTTTTTTTPQTKTTTTTTTTTPIFTTTQSPEKCYGKIIENKVFRSNNSCHTPDAVSQQSNQIKSHGDVPQEKCTLRNVDIKNQEKETSQDVDVKNQPLKCFHDPIFCENTVKPSGKRVLNADRPKYGEYKYLPQNMWIRAIQHGAVAFLYHPCLSGEQKELIRKTADSCMHRYVITPYEDLTREFPIALVTWGCYYKTSAITNTTHVKLWMRNNHTYKGPASHVWTNGKYDEKLVKDSDVPTNEMDVIICPTDEQKEKYTTTKTPPPLTHGKESIIKKRLDDAKHKRDKIAVPSNITYTKVETSRAIWAAGSLIFLCSILVGVLFYTKMWSHEERKPYDYQMVDPNGEFEYDPGYSQFSLLKSKQKFMSIFRFDRKKNTRKLDSMSRVNLMMPIAEEDGDDETIFQRK